MKTRFLIAAALVAAAPMARPQDVAKLQKEALDAEMALAMRRVTVPPCGDASNRAEVVDALWKRAKAAGLTDFSVKIVEGDADVPVEGWPSPMKLQRFDFRGSGAFSDVQFALQRIASLRILRVADFETLHVQPRAGGGVNFDGRASVVCWVADMPTHAHMPAAGTVAERESAMLRDQLRELNAWSTTLTHLEERAQPARLIDAFCAAGNKWTDRALLLSDLRYSASTVTLRGVTVGTAAKDAVAPALRDAGFETRRLDWSTVGNCRAFTATAVVTRADSEKHDFVSREIFDERTAALCNPAPPVAKVITVRGTGKLTLHSRDLTASSAFRLLNVVSPADGFLIEPGVAGRIRFDIEHATIDETLAAIRAAGFFVGGGPLHRVCAKECVEVPEQHFVGTPVNLTINDAEVVDLLRALEPAAEPLELYAAPDLQGVVSIYVVDMPWDRVIPNLVAAVGRAYRVDAPRVYMGRDAQLKDTKGFVRLNKVPVPRARRTLAQSDPAKLALADVRLNAAIYDGTDWVNYAEVVGAPDRVIELEPKTQLLDGVVESAGAGKVSLRGGRGVVTVTLAPF